MKVRLQIKKMASKYLKRKEALLLCGAFFLFSIFIAPTVLKSSYKKEELVSNVSAKNIEKPIIKKVRHIKIPDPVQAIYMTSFVAGDRNLRDKLVKIIDEKQINAVVIDVKDYTGKISFEIKNPELKKYGSEDIRVKDMREFLEELGNKGIYRIARIAVFQDPYFTKQRPDLSVLNKAGDRVWKDRKGLSWIDPNSEEYWNYIVLVGKESYDVGFDELNFDYIRYPSDGNMADISYPFSKTELRQNVLEKFFAHLRKNFNGKDGSPFISADIFGMTTNTMDDMGIGQVLEKTIPYFDAVSPMIYPSHYPPNFQGYKNPASYPYEVIHYAMNEAVIRAEKASSTRAVYRPWIQDFDLGANYGEKEVRAQIKALEDLSIKSYMIWSPSNRYTIEALD